MIDRDENDMLRLRSLGMAGTGCHGGDSIAQRTQYLINRQLARNSLVPISRCSQCRTLTFYSRTCETFLQALAWNFLNLPTTPSSFDVVGPARAHFSMIVHCKSVVGFTKCFAMWVTWQTYFCKIQLFLVLFISSSFLIRL